MPVETKLKLRRAGGSLIATIPKDVVKERELNPGDEVVVTLQTRKEILDRLIGSIPELGDSDFDRRELWGPDRY